MVQIHAVERERKYWGEFDSDVAPERDPFIHLNGT